MSGVVIDVTTKADSANKELERLNRNLAQMVTGAKSSQKALGGVSANNMSHLSTNIDRGTQSVKNFGKASKNSFGGAKAEADGLSRAFKNVQTMIVASVAAFAAFKGIGALKSASDELTLIQNRLKLATANTTELVRAQRALYQVSLQTGTSFREAANVFVDFKRSLAGLGVENRRIIDVVRTIQQAAVLSGSSTDAIKGAMVQLGQGLASGTLRGEELNSVLEQMKYIGPGLAAAMGTNIAGLRKLAEAGGLTTEKFLELVETMKAQTGKDFASNTFTLSMSMTRLQGAMKLLFGELAKHFNLGRGFAKVLDSISLGAQSAADGIIMFSNLVRRHIHNAMERLRNSSALQLTLQAVIDFKVNPTKVMKKLTESAIIKRSMRHLEKAFDFMALFSPGAIIERFKPLESGVKFIQGLRERVAESIRLLLGFYSLFEATVVKIAKIFPILQLPLSSFASDIYQGFVNTLIKVGVSLFKVVRPITRNVEALKESLALGFLGDHSLERAWVNLFRSDSMIAFTDQLFVITSKINGIRWNTPAKGLRELYFRFEDATVGVNNFLIKLGVLDNRMFNISNRRMRRLQEAVGTIGSVFKRLFDDLVLPAVLPFLAKAYFVVSNAVSSLLDAIRDAFTTSAGVKLAQSMIKFMSNAFTMFINFVKSLFRSENIFDALFQDDILVNARKKLVGAFQSFGNFISGFVKTLFGGMFKGMANLFENSLGKVGKKVFEFAKKVKDTFFDIYDKVVGRSYWPDMIDGVVDYTRNLFKAKSPIESFGSTVVGIFKAIWGTIQKLAKDSGGVFGKFIEAIGKVNFTDVFGKLAENLSVAILGAILLVFGSPALQLVGVGFFTGLFSDSLGVAFNTFLPVVLQGVGQIAYYFAEHIVKGLVTGMDLVLGAVPQFTKGFLQALLPFDGISAVFTTLVPIVNNTLVQALAIAGVAFYVFAGKWKGVLTAALIGTSANKETGEAAKAGLAQFAKELAGFKAGPGLLTALFGDRKAIALAAAVALSAALLESVSFVESITLAVPLLLFAVLGKDGGLRATRQISGVLFGILKSMLAWVGSVGLALNGLFLKLTGIDVVTKLQGVLGGLFSGLSGGADRAESNLSRLLKMLVRIPLVLAGNRDAYGAGNISFFRAMTERELPKSGVGPFRPTKGLKDGIQAVVSDFKNISTSRGPLGEVFAKIGTDFGKLFGANAQFSTKDVITGMAANMVSTFSGAFTAIGRAGAIVFRNLAGIAGTVFKFAWPAILIGLLLSLSSAAFAADKGLNQVDKGLSDNAKVVIGVTAAITALLAAMKLLREFKAVKSSALASLIETGTAEAQAAGALRVAERMAEYHRDGLPTTPRGVRNRNKFRKGVEAAEAANVASDIENVVESAKRTTSGIGANIRYAVSAVSNLGRSMASVMKSTFFNLSWWASPFKMMGNLIAGAISGFNALKASQVAVGSAGIVSSIISGIAAAMTGLGTAAWFAAGGIWAVLWPVLLVVGAVTAVGALALMLFGPGDTFQEKLEAAYDGVRKLLGLTASTSGGREVALENKLKPVKFDGKTYDFATQLERIDMSSEAMSPERYAAIEEQIAAMNETIAAVKKESAKSGVVTSGQREQVAAAVAETQDLLDRQPESADSGKDLKRRLKLFDQASLSVDNSLSSMTSRLLNLVIDSAGLTEEVDEFKSRFDSSVKKLAKDFNDFGFAIGTPFREVGKAISTGAKAIGKGLKDVDHAVRTSTAQWAKTINRKLFIDTGIVQVRSQENQRRALRDKRLETDFAAVESSLSPEERNAQALARARYLEDRKAVAATAPLGRGSDPERERKHREAILRLRISEAEWVKKTEEATAKGLDAKAVKAYQTNFRSFAAQAQTTLGIDYDKDGAKFLGDAQDRREIQAAIDKVVELKTAFRNAGDDINRQRIAIQIQTEINIAKAVSDAVSEFEASDANKIKLTAELTGGAFGEGAINRLANTTQGNEVAIATLKEMVELEAEYGLATFENRKKIRQQQITNFTELRNQNIANAMGYEEINALLENLGQGQLDYATYSGYSADQVALLSDKLLETKTLQLQLAAAKLSGPIEEVRRYTELLNASTREYLGLLNQIPQNPIPRTPSEMALDAYLGGDTAPQRLSEPNQARWADAKRRAQAARDRVNIFSSPQERIKAAREEKAANDEADALTNPPSGGKGKGGGTAQKLKDILSAITSAGVALGDMGWAMMEDSARNALRNVGKELAKINKSIEDAAPGADLAAALTRRAKLMLDVITAAMANIYRSGEDFLATLSSAGITDLTIIGSMGQERTEEIKQAYEEVLKLKQELNNATGYENIRKAALAAAAAERRLGTLAANTNRTFSDRMGLINTMFGANLTEGGYARMLAPLRDELAGIAEDVQAKVAQLGSNGVDPSNGLTAADYQMIADQLKQSGQITAIFSVFEEGILNALTQGARNAYNEIKGIFTNFDATEDQFRYVSPERRAAIRKDAEQQRLFRDLLESQMPQSIADILNDLTLTNGDEIGQRLADAIRSGDMLARFGPDSPVGKILARVVAAVPTGASTSSTALVPSGETASDGSTAVDRLEVTVLARQQRKEIEEALANTWVYAGMSAVEIADRRLRYSTAIANRSENFDMSERARTGLNIGGEQIVDERMQNLVSDQFISTFREMQVYAERIRESLALETNADRARELQIQLDDVEDSMRTMTETARVLADSARQAGKSMAEGFDSSIRDGLKALAKGEMTPKEFLLSVMDQLTNSIIDTFVDGMMQNITGPGSGINAIFDMLGRVISGGASTIGKTIGDKINPTLTDAASITKSFLDIGPEVEAVTASGNPIVNSFRSTVDSIVGMLGEGNPIVTAFMGLFDMIKGLFGMGGATAGPGSNSGIASAFSGISRIFASAPKMDTIDPLKPLSGLASVTEEVMPELGESITSTMPKLTEAIGGLGSASGATGGVGGAGLWGMIGSLVGTLFAGGFAKGGKISGPGTGTSDSIMAMVSNDEFIVNAKSTKKYGKLLTAINDNNLKHFAVGGPVDGRALQPSVINTADTIRPANGNSKQTVVNLQITGDISRQTRAEVMRMLPAIADGVNSNNKERGYR